MAAMKKQLAREYGAPCNARLVETNMDSKGARDRRRERERDEEVRVSELSSYLPALSSILQSLPSPFSP